jgi:hypothetical protein
MIYEHILEVQVYKNPLNSIGIDKFNRIEIFRGSRSILIRSDQIQVIVLLYGITIRQKDSAITDTLATEVTEISDLKALQKVV